MTCPHHSGPSKWRITFTPAPRLHFVFDCWALTSEGAKRETRRHFKKLHPGLIARRPEVRELRRGG